MNYEEQTVADLKDIAKKRNVDIQHNATKDDIIKALKKNEPKAAAKEDEPKHTPGGDFRIKGTQSDKTRLYQLQPGEKIWMTKEEAKGHGLNWVD